MKHTKIKNYLQLHFIELKYNLIIFIITFIYLFLVSYFFSNQLIYLFIKNLMNFNILKYFIFTNITEFFFTNIIISIFISALISLQLFIIQLWIFLSSGLYKYENLKFLKFYFFFLFINLIIIYLIFIKIIPNILLFFININDHLSNKYLFNIYFEPNFNNYFNFIFISYIYIYIIFIYFFILFYIIFNKIFKIEIFLNLRKFFYLKFILISNIISPPEIINQIFFIIIFIFFFEISLFTYICLYRYFFKKI
uniref:Sec-independent transporter protein n=1 Tax=Pythium insidiosum TaxID=114742 RepID=A0A0K2SS84_PYTIN|nr:Sec-independent transporter protein [Pythium insidiosum]YP_009167058.1 Sec-independent transporter protein [Pythium insidiosum]BAS30597.1 Sec-independent transporter protein [Pythium insidiosum]BAS30619.1 Sec-independent transporter protein [Pythium insidiosum]